MPVPKQAERYRGRARRAQKQLAKERARAAPPLIPPPEPGGLEEFFAWVEDKLVIPTGPLAGESFQIYPWQREFLEEALGEEIRESGLSISRKNGKTGLIAALVLGFLVGPLRIPRWRGVVISLTGVLAGELHRQIVEIAEASKLIHQLTVKKHPPPGVVQGLDGTELTLLASDKASGHAVGADLAIIDEAGLLEDNKRDLWNAVLASTSGRDGRLVCISIRGHSPMFTELAERKDDPAVVWHEYAADEDAALDDETQWHKANPGLESGIKSIRYMRDTSRRAISNPADAASFRAQDLNLPGDPGRDTIVSVADWQACIVDQLPDRDGLCILGFDAGHSASMTAAVAIWPRTGRMEAWGAFPDNPDLLTRGRSDGVGNRYETMRDRGEIWTYPGRVTPAARFLSDVADALQGEEVAYMGADRVRQADIAGFIEEAGLDWAIEWRGTGAAAFAHGSHDVRAFQRMVLDKRLKCLESVMMASAIGQSELRFDNAGNPALDKRKQASRIDALQAGVIAAGLCELWLALNPQGEDDQEFIFVV